MSVPTWVTDQGIDMALCPIDSVLRQALSPDDEKFRSGCILLQSMCAAGRAEAGVFLLGLLQRYPDNHARLTRIVESLASFPGPETVEALARELRRVPGSSATRGYLRRIVDTLGRFPRSLAEETMLMLASDPAVGTRFRKRIRALLQADAFDFE